MKRDNYYRLSLKISLFSIAINLLLAGVKLALGIISHSISILGDCVHTLSDVITTLVVILSVIISKKGPDKEHPFGHGRIEDIGTLIIALLIFLAGCNFFRLSFLRFYSYSGLKVTNLFIGIIFLTAVIKLILGFVTSKVSRKINSYLLVSDSRHHYTDFLTSLCVGTGLIFVKNGLLFVDALVGIFVSIVIMFWAVNLTRSVVDRLIGKKPSSKLYKEIKAIAAGFPQIKNLHDLNIHSYGKTNIITFHIELERDLSLEEAHSVADTIEKKVYHQGLGKCIVHVDLSKKAYFTQKKEIAETLGKLTRAIKKIKDFHGLKIFISEDRTILNLHLMIDKNTSLDEAHKISHKVSDLFKDKFGFSSVNVHVEPYVKGERRKEKG